MSLPIIPVNLDIAIIGGGVAGLWLLNRLKDRGYTSALFEAKALGSDQSVASQGMIHGGMKYTLSGALTGASEAIADMPLHWRQCLCGDGDVDLRNTRILSDHFYMWSSETMASRLTTFLASKVTRGRVDAVPDDRRPPLLRNAHFSGSLYRLQDIVLDVPTLITNLAHNCPGQIFQLPPQALWETVDGRVRLMIEADGQMLQITARRFIFTAGKGNAGLLAQLGQTTPAMQLRPLQQVMVKHHHPYRFYGHCLGAETTPRLTISSHTTRYGAPVWYLGGNLAETGATEDAETVIARAQQELNQLMPWINLDDAQWATLPVQRAEPLQRNFARPDKAFVGAAKGLDNLLVAWPTKLTLAPNLANEVLDLLAADAINSSTNDRSALAILSRHLIAPQQAATPWDLAFPPPPADESDFLEDNPDAEN